MRTKVRLLLGVFIFAFTFIYSVFGLQAVTHAATYNTVAGIFTDRSGNPVTNASFNLNSPSNGSMNFTTDSNGHYSFSVVPDVLTLQPSGTFSGNGVSFPVDLSAGFGTIDASSGNVTQNLQLDTVGLSVKFVDQSNAPISNAQVSVTATNSGGTTLLVGHPEFAGFAPSAWYTGSLDSTDVNGTTQTTIVRGIRYNVCAVDPGTNANVCTYFVPTADSSSVTLTVPVLNTVSGTFTDRSGNPVGNVQLNLDSPANGSINFSTDSNGHFSVNVVPDVLSIHAYSGFNHNDVPFEVDLSAGTGTIDASNGNVTQDLQLDTVALNVKFVDGNNAPVPNAQLSITATNAGGTTLLVGHPEFNTFAPSGWHTGSPGSTDINGVISTTVIRSIIYSVCAVDPVSSMQHCINYTPTQNVNSVTISKGSALAAPTNLAAASPTKAPHLTWNAVTGATSYNIYANGTVVGTSTTNSYIDNSPTSGSNTYYVTAVNGSGESSPSNTINVTVDNTAPVVTNVHQVWNTAKQRTDITLTFSEPVTGLPQGWYGSGTSYTKAFYNTSTATVNFVDVVGNTGSTTVTPIGNATIPPNDNANPVVTNVQQVWNAALQRTEITLTFSEAVFGLPQGWNGSGTSYTKAFYNTNPATVTFVDAYSNHGSTTVTPIGPQ